MTVYYHDLRTGRKAKEKAILCREASLRMSLQGSTLKDEMVDSPLERPLP
jgi:hypothetical protein